MYSYRARLLDLCAQLGLASPSAGSSRTLFGDSWISTTKRRAACCIRHASHLRSQTSTKCFPHRPLSLSYQGSTETRARRGQHQRFGSTLWHRQERLSATARSRRATIRTSIASPASTHAPEDAYPLHRLLASGEAEPCRLARSFECESELQYDCEYGEPSLISTQGLLRDVVLDLQTQSQTAFLFPVDFTPSRLHIRRQHCRATFTTMTSSLAALVSNACRSCQ